MLAGGSIRTVRDRARKRGRPSPSFPSILLTARQAGKPSSTSHILTPLTLTYLGSLLFSCNIFHLFQMSFDTIVTASFYTNVSWIQRKRNHVTDLLQAHTCVEMGEHQSLESRHNWRTNVWLSYLAAQLTFATLYLALQDSLFNVFPLVCCFKPIPKILHHISSHFYKEAD